MMKIAVEGCCHGELDRTYAALKDVETQTNQKVDALIIGGDFQAIRNQGDLLCMAVPQKYRQLGQFHEYYTGEKVAPVLTIVIGGNHEASNYLWELYHGGWLAPNIYYLGGSGCVRLNGVRIAGASGIFKHQDYNLSHFERLPYDNSSLRSVYHVRAYDVFKLSLLSPGPDILLSHDWPEGIYKYGDTAALLRTKPFFKQDIAKGELGNPHMMDLLKSLRPKWWFSAHLHVRFEAEYDHSNGGIKGKERVESAKNTVVERNADEIVMDDSDTEDLITASNEAGNPPSNVDETAVEETKNMPETTRFLALDKCLPKRRFLEIVDIPSSQAHYPPRLTYDLEWLAISRALHPILYTDRRTTVLPRPTIARDWIQKELEWIKEKIASIKKEKESSVDAEEIEIESIQQFVMTAPGPSPQINPRQYPPWYTNPQTEAFCAFIGVENKVNPVPTGFVAK